MNIIFGFSFCYGLIPCAFLNKKTKGIILSNHSHQQVESDKWFHVMIWNLVLNLKSTTEKFKERMTIKTKIFCYEEQNGIEEQSNKRTNIYSRAK